MNLTFDEAVRIRLATAELTETTDRLDAASPLVTRSTLYNWYGTILDDVVERFARGDMRVCPHLGPGPGIRAMFCTYRIGRPLHLACKRCVLDSRDPRSSAARFTRISPIEQMTCDRCNTYTQDLPSMGLPLGPLLLVVGLCRPCAGEVKAAPPAESSG